MHKSINWHKAPGLIAFGLMLLLTAIWTYWGAAEMYHEGWWGAWYNPLAYLIPGAVFLLLTLVGLRWPRFGGWLVIVVGIAFTLFFMDIEIVNGRIVVEREPAGFLISGVMIFFGVLFLLDGRDRRQNPPPPQTGPWWRRSWQMTLAWVIPTLIVTAVSIYMLPIVLTRVDDGDYGARLIQGNGVTLIWAPAGPGWNNKQPWGGYPGWDDIALYGLDPIGFDNKPGYGLQLGIFPPRPTWTPITSACT